MHIADRVRELRRVKASELRPNPRNWRTHPAAQQEALRGVLAEVGYAAALVARELADGTLELLDGHLRAETTPETEVPVLVVDLSDAEAAKVLATLDPLSAMAQQNDERLGDLLRDVETNSQALKEMLASFAPQMDALAKPAPPVDVAESFQVVVECRDEAQQREVFERLSGEGFECRVLSF